MRVLVVASLVVAFAAAARPARAEEVGVVVTGDAGMQDEVAAHLQRWLAKHGHTIAAAPLSQDAVDTIANCFAVNDPGCARGVVEARSKAPSVVYAHVEHGKTGDHVTLTAYWFVKGHDAIGERRECDKCSNDAWRGMADTMMDVLASGSQLHQGRLELRSRPSGLIVVLDNTQIGVTPIERDLPAGRHAIKLVRDGRTVARRQVDISSDETTRVVLDARLDHGGEHPHEGSSKLGPLFMLIGGGAMLGTGLGFIYVGERGGPNTKYIYPDSTPIGIGLGVVGAGAVLGGALWLAQSGHHSAPVAAIRDHGAYVGWFTWF